MKWSGPDSINSWLISFACCFINAMMYGISKLSGVLLVASIPRFKVERKEASFPYTLASAMRNLSGPLVGYLGYKFGIRYVTAFGALLGAIGVGLCFVADNITLVAILYGVVYGFGLGLGTTLLAVAINQYFDKHTATASGISNTGSCLGSFILPPIVEILLHAYGLSKTFLFLSAFILSCVPVALLLKKPIFEIQRKASCIRDQAERQSIIPGIKKLLYTEENEHNKSNIFKKSNSDINANTKNDTALTYEEKSKTPSTQTLLPDCSVHTNRPELADAGEVMKSSKLSKQENFEIHQEEKFTLPANNVHSRKSTEEVNILDYNTCSSVIDCKQNLMPNFQSQSLSTKHILHSKQNNTLDGFYSESYQNFRYQWDVSEIQNSVSEVSTDVTGCSKSSILEHVENQFSSLTSVIQEHPFKLIHTADNLKTSTQRSLEHSKSFQHPNIKSEKLLDKKSTYFESKQKSFLRSFSFIIEPFFVLLAVTASIHGFSSVCMLAVVVDYSKDLHIDESKEKYILMLLSVGEITGRLGLGWITDRGYMSSPAFTAVCFGFEGLFIAAVALSNDFTSLVIIVTLYGLAQSGIVVIIPVIIAQFLENDKQTVAIPSSLFLSGLLCFGISPLIGYFRDQIGAYDWIFYGMAILSAASSLSWIIFTCILKWRRQI